MIRPPPLLESFLATVLMGFWCVAAVAVAAVAGVALYFLYTLIGGWWLSGAVIFLVLWACIHNKVI